MKAALASGELSQERWALYKQLSRENTDNTAKKKAISKLAKAYQKSKGRGRE